MVSEREEHRAAGLSPTAHGIHHTGADHDWIARRDAAKARVTLKSRVVGAHFTRSPFELYVDGEHVGTFKRHCFVWLPRMVVENLMEGRPWWKTGAVPLNARTDLMPRQADS